MHADPQRTIVSKLFRQPVGSVDQRWSPRMLVTNAVAVLGCVAICNTTALAAPVIYVNGTQANVSGIVRDNQIFVPVHGIFEKLHTTVRVTSAHAITARRENEDVARLAVASRQATVNGAPRSLDTPPFIDSSTVYVPLRLISEAAGASVVYRQATHAVNITSAAAVRAASAPSTAAVTAAAPVAVATSADAVAAVAPVAAEHGIPWWVWLLLALVALALLLAFLRRRKPEPIIKTRSGLSEPVIKTRR